MDLAVCTPHLGIWTFWYGRGILARSFVCISIKPMSGHAETTLQVNVPLVHALFIHWPTSWVDGAVEHVVAARPWNRNAFEACFPDCRCRAGRR